MFEIQLNVSDFKQTDTGNGILCELSMIDYNIDSIYSIIANNDNNDNNYYGKTPIRYGFNYNKETKNLILLSRVVDNTRGRIITSEKVKIKFRSVVESRDKKINEIFG